MLVQSKSLPFYFFLIQVGLGTDFEFPLTSQIVGFQMDPNELMLEKDISNNNKIGDPLLKCAMICANGCQFFEFNDGICRLYKKFTMTKSTNPNQVVQGRMKRVVASQSFKMGPEVLIFRQDVADKIFWPRDIIASNKHNTSALRFSILDEINDFRRNDGSFHFKMCYPELNADVCYRWSQSEDPLTVYGSDIPKDFVYKDGPLPKPSSFYGLSKSKPDKCLLSADISATWWFALGTYQPFHENSFPGPPNEKLTVVELYLEL